MRKIVRSNTNYHKTDIKLKFLKIIYTPFKFTDIVMRKTKIKKRNIDIFFSFLIAINTFLLSIRILYSLIYISISLMFLKFNLQKEVNSYLSLTLLLILVAYFPDKTGYWFQTGIIKIVNKAMKKEMGKDYFKEINTSIKIIIFLRPKLWVYSISIFITVLNSLESISNKVVYSSPLWLQIKPIIFESVITMIVVDRFINLFKSEYKTLKDEAKRLTE